MCGHCFFHILFPSTYSILDECRLTKWKHWGLCYLSIVGVYCVRIRRYKLGRPINAIRQLASFGLSLSLSNCRLRPIGGSSWLLFSGYKYAKTQANDNFRVQNLTGVALKQLAENISSNLAVFVQFWIKVR